MTYTCICARLSFEKHADSNGPCEQLAVVDVVSRNRRAEESLWLRGVKRNIPVRRRVGHRRLATASLYMTHHDKHFLLAGISQESVSCMRKPLSTAGADTYSGTHMLWCRRLHGNVCKDQVLVPSQRTSSPVPCLSMQCDRELENRGRQGSGEFSCRKFVPIIHSSSLSGPLFFGPVFARVYPLSFQCLQLHVASHAVLITGQPICSFPHHILTVLFFSHIRSNIVKNGERHR